MFINKIRNFLKTNQIIAEDVAYKPITDLTVENEESSFSSEFEKIELFAYSDEDEISIYEDMLNSETTTLKEKYLDFASDSDEIDKITEEGVKFHEINNEQEGESTLPYYEPFQDEEIHESSFPDSSPIETESKDDIDTQEIDDENKFDNLPRGEFAEELGLGNNDLKNKSTLKQQVTSLLRAIEFSAKPEESIYHVPGDLEESEEIDDDGSKEILFDSVEQRFDDKLTIDANQDDVEINHSEQIVAVELNHMFRKLYSEHQYSDHEDFSFAHTIIKDCSTNKCY
ncbi:1025_t:CDS:2 [Acaulospora morrowiae]|uniref:1025_t:CDS:1 n=1 Tax=Acaulospora morrowiae TaxID=94023 RepID=A0A9N8ZXZ5_9GLOM|nr:1025_t:CDS:2 [Acaulospora morrowiae]